MIVHPSAKSPFMIQRHPREQVQRNVSFVDTCTYCNINKCTYRQMYMHGVLYLGKCICTSKCRIHFTECPDLKPLTGRTCSRSMRRKAGDSSPEHQESIHDAEASKRAGSKKRESCAYMYVYCNIDKWVIQCQINKQNAFAFQISTKLGRLVPSMKLLHHTYFGRVKVYGFGVIVHSIFQHFGHPAQHFWL